MLNRALLLDRLFSHWGFVEALTKVFDETRTPIAGLRYHRDWVAEFHLRAQTGIWSLQALSEAELHRTAPEDTQLIARCPHEVADLRTRLESDPDSPWRLFTVPVPDFTPIIVHQSNTRRYVDALCRLERHLGAPVHGGKAGWSQWSEIEAIMPRLDHLIRERAAEVGLTVQEMERSRLVFTSSLPRAELGKIELCLRLTFTILNEERFLIDEIAAVDARPVDADFYAECQPYLNPDDVTMFDRSEREMWRIDLPQYRHALVVERFFERVNIVPSSGLMR